MLGLSQTVKQTYKQTMEKQCRPRIPENIYLSAKAASALVGISVEKWIAQAIQEKHRRDKIFEGLTFSQEYLQELQSGKNEGGEKVCGSQVHN